ncbi:myosin-crossreactive antigen [Streptacidiphilus sp. EB129]
MSTPEKLLNGKRIADMFHEEFFSTNFWAMWCTTFAFEPWHSAIEFRRYLNRFVHLFKTFDTMSGIYRTKFNQFDSIVRPLLKWLTDQGVTVQLGTRVTDLRLTPGEALTVEAVSWVRDGKSEEVALTPGDLVLVTNGSMTANSTLGSTDAAPVLDTTNWPSSASTPRSPTTSSSPWSTPCVPPGRRSPVRFTSTSSRRRSTRAGTTPRFSSRPCRPCTGADTAAG